jgi:hypothetical protein
MSIQLLEHFNNDNILVEEQFGFRTKSTGHIRFTE